jgi:hypothetical protein
MVTIPAVQARWKLPRPHCAAIRRAGRALPGGQNWLARSIAQLTLMLIAGLNFPIVISRATAALLLAETLVL